MSHASRHSIAAVAAFCCAVLASAQGVQVTLPPGVKGSKEPPPTVAGPAVPGSVDKLAWMAGCWQGTSDVDGSNVHELWLAPAAGNMLGVSQTVRNEKTVGWEASRLYNEGDTVKAWLRPGARREFTMAMERFEDELVSFALTEGDTTTRLIYHRRNANELGVSFRLIRGEDRRGIDFSFKRIECSTLMSAAK